MKPRNFFTVGESSACDGIVGSDGPQSAVRNEVRAAVITPLPIPYMTGAGGGRPGAAPEAYCTSNCSCAEVTSAAPVSLPVMVTEAPSVMPRACPALLPLEVMVAAVVSLEAQLT